MAIFWNLDIVGIKYGMETHIFMFRTKNDILKIPNIAIHINIVHI